MPIVNGASGSSSSGGAELDYVTQASDLAVSATTAATAQAFLTGNAVTYDGTTRVKIEWWSANIAGGGQFIAELYDGSTDLNVRIGQGGQGGSTSPSAWTGPMYGVYFLTPSAGSHSYAIKFWRAVANMTVAGTSGGIFAPAFMRVTRA